MTGAYADTTGTTWYYWTGADSATTTAATNDTVWVAWSSSTAAASTTMRIAPTAEEVEAARVANEQQKQARGEAINKAEALLASLLTPEQRDALEKQSAFVIKSEMGRQYRLKRGWSGNVEELDDTGKPIARYCIHPSETIPHADNLTAQILMLQSQEADFRRIANRTALAH